MAPAKVRERWRVPSHAAKTHLILLCKVTKEQQHLKTIKHRLHCDIQQYTNQNESKKVLNFFVYVKEGSCDLARMASV